MNKVTVYSALVVLLIAGIVFRAFFKRGTDTSWERQGELVKLQMASLADSMAPQKAAEDSFYNKVSRLMRKKKLDSAGRLIDTALVYNPDNVRLMVNKGMIYDARGKYDSAVYEYNLVMGRYGDSLALAKMAETYIHKKQPDKAIWYYQVLSSHYPGDTAVHQKLAALQHAP